MNNEFLENVKRAIIIANMTKRLVDEVWKEEIYRDGTKMVLIPEVLFNKLKEIFEDEE